SSTAHASASATGSGAGAGGGASSSASATVGSGGAGGGTSCGNAGDTCATTFDCCSGSTCKMGTCASSASCIQAGGVCTFSDASDCCSGACDGDSCCGFYGDSCQNGFGCCEGQCIGGVCSCGPPDKMCGSTCTMVQWDDANCGDCGHTCG